MAAGPGTRRILAEIAAGWDEQISVNHEVGALIKLIGRHSYRRRYLSPSCAPALERVGGSSAEGDAPAVRDQRQLRDAWAADFEGKETILSGWPRRSSAPAATARDAGFDHVIGFDMGGTYDDVSRRRYERTSRRPSLPRGWLRAPMLAMGYGGGTGQVQICRWKQKRRGTLPGRAQHRRSSERAYRRGGPDGELRTTAIRLGSSP
ncbi:MAG: hydantoinase/oxoprolinase family protein [Mycobacterium sp.]|nr:hydantoinase/oxoprolinase family protein [Mycobacterium sp.]